MDFESVNTTSPRGLFPRGDGARAGKLRQHFSETVLKSPELKEVSVFDFALVQPQV